MHCGRALRGESGSPAAAGPERAGRRVGGGARMDAVRACGAAGWERARVPARARRARRRDADGERKRSGAFFIGRLGSRDYRVYGRDGFAGNRSALRCASAGGNAPSRVGGRIRRAGNVRCEPAENRGLLCLHGCAGRLRRSGVSRGLQPVCAGKVYVPLRGRIWRRDARLRGARRGFARRADGTDAAADCAAAAPVAAGRGERAGLAAADRAAGRARLRRPRRADGISHGCGG